MDQHVLVLQVMKLADCMKHDGAISELEIRTFLQGTVYEDFMMFMTLGRPSKFKKYDVDKGTSAPSHLTIRAAS